MNDKKRLLFQGIFWLVIWTLLWIQQGFATNFLLENLPVYLAQITLVALLIYYAGPFLLFSKKYLLFALVSLVAISVYAGIMILFKERPIPPPTGVSTTPNRPPPVFFTHSLFILIAYILGIVIEFATYTQHKEDEIKARKSEHLQTELKLLKSQINPHFIFNSLNNIYALSAIDAQKTQASISHLSTMLRYVLYECERPLVPVQKEVDYIEHYLKLFALKSSKTYPISFDYTGVDKRLMLAPMLLIPFVENALKHSNIEKITGTFIEINLTSNEHIIHFQCKNNIADESIAKDDVGGIGLDNVQKRLAILYPNSHTLVCEEQDGIFVVDLKIEHHD